MSNIQNNNKPTQHGDRNSNHSSEQQMKKSPRVKKNWIPVVAGLLKKGDKILVGQRPETHTLGGLWEFPGGKIEMGESPEIALARELSEELGIEAQIGDLKLACTHSYGDVGILILFYEVLFWKNEPRAKHHTSLEWVYPIDLPKRNIPEANRKNISRIYKAFNLSVDTNSSESEKSEFK